MAIEYEQINLNISSNASETVKAVDQQAKALNEAAKASGNAAKGMSEYDASMKAAQLETKRLSAELARTNVNINTQKAAFKSQNQEVSQSFANIQAVFSSFSGTISKPIAALQRLAQAQDQVKQASALAGLESEKAAIQQQMASIKQVQYLIAQQQAEMQFAETKRETGSVSAQVAQEQSLSQEEALAKLTELIGQEEAHRIALDITKDVYKELQEAMEAAGESAEELPDAFQQTEEAAREAQEGVGDLSKELTSLSQYSIDVKGMQAQLASGFTSMADAEQVARSATSGLSQAAIGLNIALGPLQPILVAIAAALKVIQTVGSAVEKVFNALRAAVSWLVDLAQKLVSALQKVVSVIKNFAKAIGSAASKAADYAASLVGIDRQSRKAQSVTEKLSKVLTKAWNIFQIKVLRNAINSLFGQVNEGFQQLALDSAQFNQSMSSGVSAVRGLSNSLVAALAPAINAVMPLITALAGAIRTVLNLVAALTAALFGQASYFVANDVWENFTAGASGAAAAVKEVNEAVNRLSFDELTTISDMASPAGGGGGGGGGGGDWFTELDTPSLQDLLDSLDVREWVRSIIKALNDIDWTEIKNNAEQIGRTLARLLNDAVDEFLISDTPGIIGKTIAEALNTAVRLAYGFLDDTDFARLGELVGININEGLKTIEWAIWGRTISLAINGWWDFVLNTLKQIDFAEFGQNVGIFLNESIGRINFETIGETLALVLNSAFIWLANLVETFNLMEVAKNIAAGINKFLADIDPQDWANTLTAVFTWAVNSFARLVSDIDGTLLAQNIIAFFQGIGWDEIQEALFGLFEALWSLAREVLVEFGIEIPAFSQLLIALSQVVDFLADSLTWLLEAFYKIVEVMVGPYVKAILQATGHWEVFENAIDSAKETVQGTGDAISGTLRGVAIDSADSLSQVQHYMSVTGSDAERLAFLLANNVTDIEAVVADSTTEISDETKWLLTQISESSAETYEDYRREIEDWSDKSKYFASIVKESYGELNTAILTDADGTYREYQEKISDTEDFTKKSLSALTASYDELNTDISTGTDDAYQEVQDTVQAAADAITGNYNPAIEDSSITLTDDILDAFDNSYTEIDELVEKTDDSISDNNVELLADMLLQNEDFVNDVQSKVIDSLTQAWQEHGDIFAGIMQDMTDAYKEATNLMIGYTNAMMSGVTAGVNTLIDAINSLKVDIPSWVPDIGGKSFNPSLSHVSSGSIPMLAEGGVIPPNNPFLAIMGEQKHGTNVEAPLSTIQQALANVLASPAQPGSVHVIGTSGGYNPITYSAGGAIASTGNAGAAIGGIAESLSEALQANAQLFEQPTFVVGDEQVARANDNYQKNRGVALGGAFATVR